jgi:hypothetical protein
VQKANSALPKPIHQVVNQSFAERPAIPPSGLEATMVWMSGQGYTVNLLDPHPPPAPDECGTS